MRAKYNGEKWCCDCEKCTIETQCLAQMEIRLSNLKQMRNKYMSFRCYPRPKSSPYDKEIAKLEKELEV